ncbi:MAG TPA: cyclopropane-fatty-acyl-phospholipid synthase family protein [Casimicrobiaceae bacterium]|nr:cyclopropane-fatty-acyl-phospholipid synthase family protein [Casimicrobiaceae bacterium]
MNPLPTHQTGRADIGARAPSGAVRKLLDAMMEGSSIPCRIVFSNGGEYRNGDAPPRFTIVFRRRRGELRLLRFGHVGLLEAYFDGDVDVEGEFPLAFRVAMDRKFSENPNGLVRMRNRWHEMRYSNRSIAQAKANARFHYGLGKAFYAPWLDRIGMMYTCAYWKEGTRTLEEAQRNKMDHVCRKVQLRAGETFVDVGCGWGGLMFHAWKHYGAIGTGINATTEQVAELREDLARAGLADKLKVVECDFREIPGQYDKLLSIGTLEHAGRDQLPAVVKAHADAMKPGALGVIHFIGHVGSFDTEFYIRKYIFPGGWIPSLHEAIDAMDACGLEVLDIENLRRHYALTLDEWAARFDANWEAMHALDPARFDERLRRIWRTYLWSCAEMFRSRTSRTHLFQVTVSKGNVKDYPMSRAFLYAQGSPSTAATSPPLG